MRSALESAHRGWGVSCVIGVAAAGQELSTPILDVSYLVSHTYCLILTVSYLLFPGKEISTRPFQLITGRKWMGTAFGGYKARDGVPSLVEEHLEGSLPLDHFVSARFNGLASTFDAIESMHSGKVLRAVVSY